MCSLVVRHVSAVNYPDTAHGSMAWPFSATGGSTVLPILLRTKATPSDHFWTDNSLARGCEKKAKKNEKINEKRGLRGARGTSVVPSAS